MDRSRGHSPSTEGDGLEVESHGGSPSADPGRSRLHPLFCTLGAVWAMGSALPAMLEAQQRDTLRTDSTVFRIEGIRIQAERPVTTIGGASAIEVTLDSLDLAAAPTVEDVLRELPSVHVRTNSRGQAEISVRGSESRQVAVFLDGVPLTLSWDARTDLSVLPADAVREINFVRGLSSILHGPNVLGGVVEMNVGLGRRLPAGRSLYVRGGFDQEGGYATSTTAEAPFVTSGGEGVVRAGAGFRDSPGFPLPAGVVEPEGAGDGLRLNTDLRNVDGFMAARYVADGGAWGSLSATSHRARRGIGAEIGADKPRLWRYPHISRTIVAASMGSGERSTPVGEGDLEASLGLDIGRTEIDSYASRAYDEIEGSETGDDRTVTLRVLGDHTLGPRADVRTAFTFADIGHDESIDGVTRAFQQRILSLGAESVVRVRQDAAGTVQAVRLSFGGAYDRSSTPETGGLPSLGAIGDWGARLGLSALARDGNVMVHAAVSRRGRFPSLRETYSEALHRFKPNPDLGPEHLVAFETGVTARAAGGEVQVVGFRHRTTGAIRRITLPDRLRQRVNSDELRSTGVEVLLSQSFGRLSVGGDLTLQSVTLTDPGAHASKRPENLPERSGTAFVGVPVAGGVSLTAEARYTGRQFCQDPDTGADVELEGGAWLNARLSRTWGAGGAGSGRRIETTVAGSNLADTALYDQCGLPRPGRLLQLQFRVF